MPVYDVHPEYSALLKKCKLVRAIVNHEAQSYIRVVDPEDMERSTQYREDAILTNFTNLTRVGLTGLVFRKPYQFTVPIGLEYIEDNVTGTGLTLTQFSQNCVSEILQTGRLGLLTDYPKREDIIDTLDPVDDINFARIKVYTAENIINWKTKTVGNTTLLWYVVLREFADSDPNDIFSWAQRQQCRVLLLNDKNVYEQYVYNDKGVLTSYAQPTDSDGNPWGFIPFSFVGSENNDWTIDYQPLYDMAVINLGHYRNSADFEESTFISGQPFIVVKLGDNDTPESFAEANPNGIRCGSRSGLILGAQGDAKLLQVNANTLVDTAMKRKEEQAVAIGARLIAPAGQGRETAEAARIRFGSQNSALYTLTTNIALGIEKALKWCARYMGVDASSVSFVLNRDFYDETADPNLIAQMIVLGRAGIIAKKDIRDYGRKTGFIDDTRTDEELDNEADLELDPLDDGMGLPQPSDAQFPDDEEDDA